MIVVDASSLAELIPGLPGAAAVARRLRDPRVTLHAPHLIDVEIAHALRRYTLRGDVGPGRADEAVRDLLSLPLRRYPHDVLLPRIWTLRESLTAYDAAYVALAEALDAPPVTRDERLARAHGHRARIELV